MQLFEIKKIKSHIGIIHFIGIGGIGISGIAEIMHHLGYQVQGSDVTENNNTQRLQKLGIKIFYQHEANNILGAEYIVVSSAIKKNNIEILSALEQKIPVLTRAEMLAELMRFKNSIAVSGSHGKTTTTSLIACMIEAAGLAPTVINGGIINNRSTNAYIGPSPYLVAEADESDATFIRIPSSISVITNIDPEHMDYYHSFDNLVHAFKQFILNLPFYGFAIACIDHDMVRNMIKDITTRHIITYGIDHESAHVRAFNIKLGHFHSEYDVIINLPNLYGPITIEKIYLPIPGKHNVLNSLAAIAIAAELDFGLKVIQKGFIKFQGVGRRFTKIYDHHGMFIIDDYAHHPEEIKATLLAAKNITSKTGGRIISIFQPHRYSRLKYLFNDFLTCFDIADVIYITDTYGAGEIEIEEFNSQALITIIPNAKKFDNIYQISYLIQQELNSSDLILFMGAGNITQIAHSLVDHLKQLKNISI